MRDVTRGLPASEVPTALQEFSVVNFNYDRCFEHFVFFWLKRVYDFSDAQAAEALAGINIWHPYGKLGNLPFQSQTDGLPFGAKLTANRLLEIKERIRTYSEAVEDQSAHETARRRLAEAKKIVFLGFGFHGQNVELLSPPEDRPRNSAHCYGTAFEVPDPKWEVFRERLRAALGIESSRLFFNKVSGTCEDLWRDFGETVIA